MKIVYKISQRRPNNFGELKKEDIPSYLRQELNINKINIINQSITASHASVWMDLFARV